MPASSAPATSPAPEHNPTPASAPAPASNPAPAPAIRGSTKIVIKGTKAGAAQPDIARALVAATRKLGTSASGTDANAEMRMANEAADAILAGDKVVLEGATPEAADAIAQDLRKAGLLVTTTK